MPHKPPIDLLAIEPDPKLRQLLLDFVCDWLRIACEARYDEFKPRLNRFRQEFIEAGYDWETFRPYFVALLKYHNENVRIIRNATRFMPVDTPDPFPKKFFR